MDHTMDTTFSLKSSAGAVLGGCLIIAQLTELYFFVSPDCLKLLRWMLSSTLAWLDGVARLLKLCISPLLKLHSYHFFMPGGQRNTVILESTDHIRELSDTHQLSQRAVYADIFGFRQSMKHGSTPLDPNEQTPARYKLFSSAIRSIGVSQLSSLQPYLQARLENTLNKHVNSTPSKNGWHSVKLGSLSRNMVTGMLGTYFFGDLLYEEPEFHHATLDFYHDVFRCMGTLQIVPSYFKDTVYGLMTNNGQSLRVLFERLLKAIRNEKGDWEEDSELKQLTLFHIMVELSQNDPYWTPETLIQAVVGIWFAASHQPWINFHFIFLELCDRPDDVEMLRDELKSHPRLDAATLTSLPLLDSFIKESVRLNPLDKLAIRRKALSPYTFSKGGPSLKAGQTVCISAHDIMHNGARYPNPDTFDATRFVRRETTNRPGDYKPSPTRGSTFTDASKDFPVWGFGTRVCPGRWHAELVLKLALAELILNYEFQLEEPNERHKWWWESFQLPFESTKVSFRKRTEM